MKNLTFLALLTALLGSTSTRGGVPLEAGLQIYRTPDRMDAQVALQAIASGKMARAPLRSTHGLTNDYFWYRFSVPPGYDLLELNSPHTDTARLYRLLGGEPLLRGEGGDRMPFSRRMIRHHKLLFPLDGGEEKAEYLLFLDKQGGSANFPLYLWDQHAFALTDARERFWTHLSYGFLLFFLLAAILFGLMLRRDSFLSYSAFVGVVLAYHVTTKGHAFEVFYPEQSRLNDYLRFVLLPMFGLTYTWFARTFLKVQDGLSASFMGYFLVLLLSASLLPERWLQPALLPLVHSLYLVMLATAAWSFYAVVRVWRRHPRRSRWFLAAFSGNGLVLVYQVLLEYGYLEKNLVVFDPFLIAVFQGLVVMCAVMYHFLSRKLSRRILVENALKQEEATPSPQHRLRNGREIDLSGVALIESLDHDLFFHAPDGKWKERRSIRDFLRLSYTSDYLQVHKSYLVHRNHILSGNGRKVLLRGGAVVPLSRTYRDKFRHALTEKVVKLKNSLNIGIS